MQTRDKQQSMKISMPRTKPIERHGPYEKSPVINLVTASVTNPVRSPIKSHLIENHLIENQMIRFYKQTEGQNIWPPKLTPKNQLWKSSFGNQLGSI
jgi:hypothetical protein